MANYYVQYKGVQLLAEEKFCESNNYNENIIVILFAFILLLNR